MTLQRPCHRWMVYRIRASVSSAGRTPPSPARSSYSVVLSALPDAAPAKLYTTTAQSYKVSRHEPAASTRRRTSFPVPCEMIRSTIFDAFRAACVFAVVSRMRWVGSVAISRSWWYPVNCGLHRRKTCFDYSGDAILLHTGFSSAVTITPSA